jgi:selenide,water dikinase
MNHEVCLTEFGHGGGCGGKIASTDLEVLLQSELVADRVPGALLVDGSTRDDAAIYDLGDGNGVISTTDFSMPLVDDPFDFGRIAATNAISDIYAMGGKPIMAIAVFGWPVKLLPLAVGRLVLDGGRQACRDAGIAMAGGHSVDTPEPIFGLAVTGLVRTEHIKRNNTAQPGNKIFLTKPLGVGILTTAQQRKALSKEHQQIAIESMCRLNHLGEQLGRIKAVTAMTDVTGFGLAGHLIEICEGSGVGASIDFDSIPILPQVSQYLKSGYSPAGTQQNISSAGSKLGTATEFQQQIVFDPQTSGGLLVVVDEDAEGEFLAVATDGQMVQAIGRIVDRGPGSLVEIL